MRSVCRLARAATVTRIVVDGVVVELVRTGPALRRVPVRAVGRHLAELALHVLVTGLVVTRKSGPGLVVRGLVVAGPVDGRGYRSTVQRGGSCFLAIGVLPVAVRIRTALDAGGQIVGARLHIEPVLCRSGLGHRALGAVVRRAVVPLADVVAAPGPFLAAGTVVVLGTALGAPAFGGVLGTAHAVPPLRLANGALGLVLVQVVTEVHDLRLGELAHAEGCLGHDGLPLPGHRLLVPAHGTQRLRVGPEELGAVGEAAVLVELRDLQGRERGGMVTSVGVDAGDHHGELGLGLRVQGVGGAGRRLFESLVRPAEGALAVDHHGQVLLRAGDASVRAQLLQRQGIVSRRVGGDARGLPDDADPAGLADRRVGVLQGELGVVVHVARGHHQVLGDALGIARLERVELVAGHAVDLAAGHIRIDVRGDEARLTVVVAATAVLTLEAPAITTPGGPAAVVADPVPAATVIPAIVASEAAATIITAVAAVTGTGAAVITTATAGEAALATATTIITTLVPAPTVLGTPRAPAVITAEAGAPAVIPAVVSTTTLLRAPATVAVAPAETTLTTVVTAVPAKSTAVRTPGPVVTTVPAGEAAFATATTVVPTIPAVSPVPGTVVLAVPTRETTLATVGPVKTAVLRTAATVVTTLVTAPAILGPTRTPAVVTPESPVRRTAAAVIATVEPTGAGSTIGRAVASSDAAGAVVAVSPVAAPTRVALGPPVEAALGATAVVAPVLVPATVVAALVARSAVIATPVPAALRTVAAVAVAAAGVVIATTFVTAVARTAPIAVRPLSPTPVATTGVVPTAPRAVLTTAPVPAVAALTVTSAVVATTAGEPAVVPAAVVPAVVAIVGAVLIRIAQGVSPTVARGHTVTGLDLLRRPLLC